MIRVKKQTKLIVASFVLLILFQSCVAFKSTPVSLEQAVRENVKTKIKTNNGENIKFKYISYENGTYYGINNKNKELVKVALSEEQIDKIRLKNKNLSVFLNVLLGISILVLAPAVAYASGGGV